MLIHERYVFIHLPKTGGTFLASALRREMPPGSLVRGAPGKKHPGWDDIPQEARNRPVLVYVRNPWDWYVSWYHAAVVPRRPPGEPATTGVNDFDTVIRAACSGLIGPSRLQPLPPGEREDFYTTRIRRFCSDGLSSDRLTFGRFESLVDDLDNFLSAAGAPLDDAAIARIRGAEPLNTTNHRHYRDYYSDDLRDLVRECCRMPIERFGYHF
jgi:hypothetical protein